jgi:hypothetical protein
MPASATALPRFNSRHEFFALRAPGGNAFGLPAFESELRNVSWRKPGRAVSMHRSDVADAFWPKFLGRVGGGDRRKFESRSRAENSLGKMGRLLTCLAGDGVLGLRPSRFGEHTWVVRINFRADNLSSSRAETCIDQQLP